MRSLVWLPLILCACAPTWTDGDSTSVVQAKRAASTEFLACNPSLLLCFDKPIEIDSTGAAECRVTANVSSGPPREITQGDAGWWVAPADPQNGCTITEGDAVIDLDYPNCADGGSIHLAPTVLAGTSSIEAECNVTP